jgi:hypothetical protein
MKRICSLCLKEYHYASVKKHRHGLQLCVMCERVIETIALTNSTIKTKLGPF